MSDKRWKEENRIETTENDDVLAVRTTKILVNKDELQKRKKKKKREHKITILMTAVYKKAGKE